MYTRTKVHVTRRRTTIIQRTLLPYPNPSASCFRVVSQLSLQTARENNARALPEAPLKWSTVTLFLPEPITCVCSFSNSIIPLLDILFLQLPNPFAWQTVEITLISGMPHQGDIVDISLDHCPLAGIFHISWFHYHWILQSMIFYPEAVIGTTSCALLQHATHFSPQPHVFGLLVPKVSVGHHHVQWPCILTCQQSHQIPTHCSKYSPFTIRVFADHCNWQRWWQSLSINSLSIGHLWE